MEILATVQLAKQGSKHFNKYTSIVENGNYYWCDHNGGIPKTTKDMKPLTKEELTLILSVINDYQTHRDFFTGGYSWLVIGCYYKGLNLVERGFISL